MQHSDLNQRQRRANFKGEHVQPGRNFLIQIKMKELKMQEIRETSLMKKNPGDSFDPVKIKAIAESIWSYFGQKKISNLFMARVIERLSKAGCTSMMERAQIDRHVREVARRCPLWLSVVPNPEGDILRQAKPNQLTEIYKLLDL